MDPSKINWLAVVVATIAFFALGALWYSPVLFVKTWMKELNITKEDTKKASMAKILPLTLILTFIMVTNLAFFISDPKITVGQGALYGFLTGFGWVGLAMILTSLYELKGWRYMFINAGYMAVGFTLSGVILAAWK
ncbi:MAG: DUF1761 domain-containing protein [Bacteroidetes bacterium]|nr:DUF1761 domain-containing protein [Bacteroidota bacterium]